jgi:hypothetical protein
VFIVILWQRSSDPVDRKPGRLADIFRLFQHLPERQPGAQARSRAPAGRASAAQRSLDAGEHLAKVEQVLEQMDC